MDLRAAAELDLPLLFPRPQRLQLLGGGWLVPSIVRLHAAAGAPEGPAFGWLEQALAARGHRLERTGEVAAAQVQLRIEPSRAVASRAQAAGVQGYSLVVAGGGLVLVAGGLPGLQHGLATLSQLVLMAPLSAGQVELPALSIEDFPDFPQRGVMLDVSRDKVPTLSTLFSIVERLALWKVNQLQLYMEHTFAYPGHEVVWQGASAFSADEIRELDRHCAERHIELVPNQNSFGHMQRWLVHEPYRQLAECPDGFEHPWNWSGAPYGLCATDPGSLTFLGGLYDELLPSFQSRRFNVGLDETLDLGCGRSRAACEEQGTERVYLEFLKGVHDLVRERGHVMQFWGDIIIKRPDLIGELPPDAVALEWGYEADHPFAEHLASFQRAGLEFYVCPGTSSWCSIAGRTDNAIANLAGAALAGKAAGAAGLLVTDWGDHGHLQPLSVSYLGLLLAAGFSWNVSDAARASELDVPRLLDAHAFFDPAGVLGRVACDLGNAYREAGSLRPNASVLFWSLIKPERLFSPAGVTQSSLESALSYIERVSEPLARARPGMLAAVGGSPEARASEGALVARELGWARDVLRFSCRLGIARCTPLGDVALGELPWGTRSALADELRELMERQREIWLARNRPGGLDDSLARLESLWQTLTDRGESP